MRDRILLRLLPLGLVGYIVGGLLADLARYPFGLLHSSTAVLRLLACACMFPPALACYKAD